MESTRWNKLHLPRSRRIRLRRCSIHQHVSIRNKHNDHFLRIVVSHPLTTQLFHQLLCLPSRCIRRLMFSDRVGIRHHSCSGPILSHPTYSSSSNAPQFNEWNPGVGTSCLYLDLGDYVCVGEPIPSPLQPGTISTCTAFYLVVSGDYCSLIEEEYGITAEQVSQVALLCQIPNIIAAVLIFDVF